MSALSDPLHTVRVQAHTHTHTHGTKCKCIPFALKCRQSVHFIDRAGAILWPVCPRAITFHGQEWGQFSQHSFPAVSHPQPVFWLTFQDSSSACQIIFSTSIMLVVARQEAVGHFSTANFPIILSRVCRSLDRSSVRCGCACRC